MDSKLIGNMVVALVGLVNTVCAMFNVPQLDVTEEQVYQVVSVVAMCATWAYSCYSNFNFTEAAKIGQGVTDTIKELQETSDKDFQVEVKITDLEE